MSEGENIYLLYVDDEPHNLEAFRANFRKGYTVFTALNAVEARLILASNEIHILITDQKLPVTLGTQLLEESIKAYPQQVRILLTAYATTDVIKDAISRGLVFRFILKPYEFDELKSTIDDAFEMYRLKQKKETLYSEFLRTEEKLMFLENKSY